MFLCDSEAESSLLVFVGPVKHGEHLIPAAFCFLENVAERCCSGEAAPLCEALVRAAGGCYFIVRGSGDRALLALRRKLRSPFRAAALQYETAGFCCHPGAESVGAGPLDSAGLKCAFHCDATWLLFAHFRLRRYKLSEGASPPPRRPARVRGGPFSVNRIRPYGRY